MSLDASDSWIALTQNFRSITSWETPSLATSYKVFSQHITLWMLSTHLLPAEVILLVCILPALVCLPAIALPDHKSRELILLVHCCFSSSRKMPGTQSELNKCLLNHLMNSTQHLMCRDHQNPHRPLQTSCGYYYKGNILMDSTAGMLIKFLLIGILISDRVNDDHIISIRILCKQKIQKYSLCALKANLEIQLNDITVELSSVFHMEERFDVQF